MSGLSLYQDEHAACGVGLIANIPNPQNENIAQHQLVDDALTILENFEYRSGVHPATDECDGAGIRFFGLPTSFFNRLLINGNFELTEGTSSFCLKDSEYAIGNFFFPNDNTQISAFKETIRLLALAHHLNLVAWRDLGETTDDTLLSERALEKKPALWQAVFLTEKLDFSFSLKNLFIDIYNQLPDVHIVSLSEHSMVYKGMIKPSVFKNYFNDFSAADFDAKAAIIHGRFATNTNPQWKNAQPCNHFIAHNGEFNSANANLLEMQQELAYREIHGLMPQAGMSDSLQFDYDLFNQCIIHGSSLIESIIRLMPPQHEDKYDSSVQAMLEWFRRMRAPYNGPAFVVGGLDGYFFAKLDDCGLRPSRLNLIEFENGMQRLCATSDDFWLDSASQKIIKKTQLSPGGMLVICPDGQIMETEDVLHHVVNHYTPAYFENLIHESTHLLPNTTITDDFSVEKEMLNRQLFACGWSFENISDGLRMMAENAQEPLAAMGDDTNPLHSEHLIVHLSYFFHQLFAQVSAPSIDSIREKEKFNLNTILKTTHYIPLESPILRPDIFKRLNMMKDTPVKKIFTHISYDPSRPHEALIDGIAKIMQEVRDAYAQGYHLFEVTDEGISPEHIVIPDLIAVAAIKKVLNETNQSYKASIVVNSLQISGPHQASCLLAIGAQAIFARGAYLKTKELYEDYPHKFENYCKALEKSLLKTMGKLGITDVNNYINGQFIAALGLDLQSENESISLASLFGHLYSPLKGIQLKHVALALLQRHQFAYDAQNRFNLLPLSGYYMPEKSGIVHGYGPEVMNAFSAWIKAENLKASLYQMHRIFEKRYQRAYLKDLEAFQIHHGFLDPSYKENGFYPQLYLEQFKVSKAFNQLSQILNHYKHTHPTCLRDYLKLKDNLDLNMHPEIEVQSQASIRQCLFSGSMSQGALTVANPDTPQRLGAHETLTRGMNAIGSMSASGEGGENDHDLRTPLSSTRSKQIASGRFGISARQIIEAQEMEIKISQGAKPGEGGELPGTKVSIRFAAQRGGLPGVTFVSPPPHHDIYSIEDLEQLIRDIKTVHPKIEVAVKLVASKGIGTIAVGVAKAGADVINIASNSGGTAAALQSSIKHSGLPGEIGLVEVDSALRHADLRSLVKLRTSGGIKSADDIIVGAILGADQFELGTTAMITLGCKMQRTCNKSCQPGVATDGHLFKGEQITTERFFVNLAAQVQDYLKKLGISHLQDLRRKTHLLELIDTPFAHLYDFDFLLNNTWKDSKTALSANASMPTASHRLSNTKELSIIASIHDFFSTNPGQKYTSDPIELNSQDLSFGAGIAGAFVQYLEEHPNASIHLNSHGVAGQSMGFVMPKNMSIHHRGIVQDGCGKSMTGGELVIQSHAFHSGYKEQEHTIGGNALLYGASSGKIFINGRVGHRCGILMKGAQVVVEGVGDLGFEYMTSGTALILGSTGKGLGTGATGGIIICYVKHQFPNIHEAFEVIEPKEADAYENVIKKMLLEHLQKTESIVAKDILEHFTMRDFGVFVAKEFSKIKTLKQVNEILKTYQIRQVPLTLGMQVWLEQKILKMLSSDLNDKDSILEFKQLIAKNASLFSSRAYAQMNQHLVRIFKLKESETVDERPLFFSDNIILKSKKTQSIQKRLSTLSGELDELLLDVFSHLNQYISNLKDDADGCSGCRAQSCAGGEKVDTGCPSGKSINTINATLKKLGEINDKYLTKQQWQLLREAFELQVKESPFISYTGAACPAPCQDACTESIPTLQSETKLRGKSIGEPVHIKQIEFLLYQLGRYLGWFGGNKSWSHEEIDYLFGSSEAKYLNYDTVMVQFKPVFQRPELRLSTVQKKLVIIGSGPAGMQMAYEALKDGIEVLMYEKSDKPGGLLVDGIPAHKFDKIYITEDFEYLKNMGLQLFLNSEVCYSEEERLFKNGESVIASSDDKNIVFALCVGAGLSKAFPKHLTQHLSQEAKSKIVQATEFLKAANDVACILKNNPSCDLNQQEEIIHQYLSQFDPRGKKIVVVGGGDTAQDVIRWVARYFNHSESLSSLEVLVRGPNIEKRGLQDAYPMPSKGPTPENLLKNEEVLYIQGQVSHLVETRYIQENEGQLSIGVSQSKYLNYETIENDLDLKQIFDDLPRESREIDETGTQHYQIDNVDMIICALGFQGRNSHVLAEKLNRFNLPNVFFAGDASEASQQIIVGAQANAKNTYEGQIMPFFGLNKVKHISMHSMFEQVKWVEHTPARIPKINF